MRFLCGGSVCNHLNTKTRTAQSGMESHFGIVCDSSGILILLPAAALKVVAHHCVVSLPRDATACFLWGRLTERLPRSPPPVKNKNGRWNPSSGKQITDKNRGRRVRRQDTRTACGHSGFYLYDVAYNFWVMIFLGLRLHESKMKKKNLTIFIVWGSSEQDECCS